MFFDQLLLWQKVYCCWFYSMHNTSWFWFLVALKTNSKMFCRQNRNSAVQVTGDRHVLFLSPQKRRYKMFSIRVFERDMYQVLTTTGSKEIIYMV